MGSYDPFDIWATERLGRLKSSWYSGNRSALLLLGGVYFVDLLAPQLLRRVMGIKETEFAHVLAILQDTKYAIDENDFVSRIDRLRTEFGWGLGFNWYSANGVYSSTVPYVTNTPYVMAALLKVAEGSTANPRARTLFDETWLFLASLKEKYRCENTLALSYSPKDEPHIVINANSYSAWAYAMHACHGRDTERRAEAEEKALKIIRWIIEQQYEDGRWYYLADRNSHDMIDGFHSCFIVRNFLNVARLLPAAWPLVEHAVEKGWAYLKHNIFDPNVGLARRYSVISRPDAFSYDLYDQAEYLGLLIDFGEIEAAHLLRQRVRERFIAHGTWYCRIDRLGRRWGPGFLRWGIAQFWANEARLEKLDAEK